MIRLPHSTRIATLASRIAAPASRVAALAFLVLASLASPGSFGIGSAHAQGFPNKPVKIVVPFPPGAATDTLARLLGQKLTESWGQSVVIDNKPGAGSIIAAQAVATAAPDGYTIFMGHIGTHGANPALYAKLPYDPVKDFAPITLLVSIPNLLAVHPSLPVNNVGELIALAKAKPGALNVASPGVSTSAHLIISLFRSMTGADMTHVPFKGSVASMQALVAGDVTVAFDTVTAIVPHARAGRIKMLATTSKERAPSAAEVPPLSEAGVPGFDVATWFAFFAPANTPRAAIDKLNADTVRVLQSKEVAERLSAMGMNTHGGTPEQLAAHVTSEIARWGRVVKEANIKVE